MTLSAHARPQPSDIRALPDSRAEALIRLMIADLGLPEPEVNLQVAADGATHLLALAWPQWLIDIEFRSDQEFPTGEQIRKHRRRHALKSRGWRIIEFADDELHNPKLVEARLSAAIVAATTT
ncbi:MAG: hypothetical protein LBH48_00775 [Bifidobacteriaceae bacterium]|nr:hypothetical protein [Bifidobacteriaceae bacterium]